MKTIQQLLLLLLLLGSGLLARAQSGDFSTSLTVGVTTPILDNGSGFHLGVNPAYAISGHFSLEGQLSYLSTKITGSFVSGDQGEDTAVNALIGGRLYVNAPEKRNRFYINLLLGASHLRETRVGVERPSELNLGISAGVFADLNRILVGFSFDSPQNLVLKAGYVF